MRYQLLGPLRVEHDGRRIELGPPKQRAVLAVLLLAGGAVVSVDRLIDAVWGDDAPGSAMAGLQAYISNLRKALRSDGAVPSPIVRQAPGYHLALADEVDLVEFTRHCLQARDAATAGRWSAVLTAADGALAMRRGPLLEDLADHGWVAAEAVRVDELHTECVEHRVSALLALGRVGEALSDAVALRAVAPLRDRGAWLHMLALYRSGRGPEALEVYTAHAAHLDAELGLDPGSELREMQTLILRQAPELDTWPRSPAWSGADEVPAPAAEQVAADEPAPARAGPLIGRDRETSRMAELLADSVAGSTRWLVLTGPAGIGKTRLAEEAARRAAGTQVVWVSCPDERGAPPWWPMRQLVRALGADADAVLQVPRDADPDTARFLVYERIHLLLQAPRPLVLVIDDVQWADATSLSALAYLAGVLRDHPVAVILTVRDGENPHGLERLLGAVARSDGNLRIDVSALGAADVALLANDIADTQLTGAETATLAARTGGNPFFVSEYARLPPGDRAGGDIPSAIRTVLDRRLAGLDSAVLQVLRTAAVIGDLVDGSAITLLAATTGLDIDTLADHLDEAADERILVAAHGRPGYEFAHGLLREHLLAGLAPLRRQRLHARVAEHLSPDLAGHRARHLIDAMPLVEPRDVVDACRLAAEQAAAQWSSETAAGWWQAALDAYDQAPASQRADAERDALTVALLQALARSGRGQTVLDAAAVGLTDALRSGRAATAGRIAAELLRVAGGWPWVAPGVEPGELLALLGRAVDLTATDPVAGARVRAALAVGQCYHPDPGVPAALLAQSARLADATSDPDVVAEALLGKLITYSGVPAFSRESLGWADGLISLLHSRSHEDAVIAHSVATMAAFDLGDFPAVRTHLQAGIVGSEELRLPVLRAQLRWMETVYAIWRGEFASAGRHLGIAGQVHEQTELYGVGSGLVALACLKRELGEPVDASVLPYADEDLGGNGMFGIAGAVLVATRTESEAHAAAEELLRGQRADGHVWIGLGHATLLAHVCADHGLAEFAPELLRRLESHRDEIALIGQIGVAGPVALATARLHFLVGDAASARRDLAVAAEIARRGEGVPSLLRIRLLACELDGGAGAGALAEDAERLGMRGVAAAARGLLGRPGE